MPKRKKISTEVWVALIGLIGVIIAAVLASPILLAILQSTPDPPIEQTQASALTPQSTFVSTSVTQATVTSRHCVTVGCWSRSLPRRRFGVKAAPQRSCWA